jgi:hypothetical protein
LNLFAISVVFLPSNVLEVFPTARRTQEKWLHAELVCAYMFNIAEMAAHRSVFFIHACLVKLGWLCAEAEFSVFHTFTHVQHIPK